MPKYSDKDSGADFGHLVGRDGYLLLVYTKTVDSVKRAR